MIYIMKLYPIILLLTVTSLSLIAAEAEHQNQDSALTTRVSNLPRAFEFDTYVALYHKQYANMLERLNRMRLFLARLCMVFAKANQYVNRLESYFLGINEMSDWTADERAKLHQTDGLTAVVSAEEPIKMITSAENPETVAAATSEDIDKILDDILEHEHHERPAISEFVQQSFRMKRSTSENEQKAESPRRSLSFDQLIKDPKKASIKVSPKLVASVPSNNPGYEAPQLMSEGVDDDEDKMPPIGDPIKEENLNGNLFADIFSKITSVFQGEQVEVGKIVEKADEKSSAGQQEAAGDRRTEVFLDYRDTNCISPVKDQRKCNSCYSFSVLSVYEYLHCQQTGKLVSFAEQFVVDCGQRFGMNGCKGGKIELVAHLVNKMGLELGTYYPYRARVTMCPYGDSDKLSQIGHTRVENGRMVVMWLQLMYIDQVEKFLKTKGPLTITIAVNDNFHDYAGGVHRLKGPKKDSAHAMTLVGHGIQEGEEYWLIRNSYGPNWGEQGYYKLSKDNVDPASLLWVSFIEAKFMENEKHNLDEVRQKVLKNRSIFERLFDH